MKNMRIILPFIILLLLTQFALAEVGDVLTVNSDVFDEGDTVEVTLKSRPNGSAWFYIQDIAEDIPMKEVSSGIYKGTYNVKYGDNIKNAVISAKAEYYDTRQDFVSSQKITISTYFFKVKILSPKQDEEVDLYFDIVGKTRPNTLVNISPQTSIGGSGNIFSPNSRSSLGSVPGAIEITSDEKGFFKVRYGFPIKIPIISVQYKFFVTAIDKEGRRSLPSSLSVKVKKNIKTEASP